MALIFQPLFCNGRHSNIVITQHSNILIWNKAIDYPPKVKALVLMDAKKAVIRAEDIARGVFVPVSNLPHREPQKGAKTT